MNRRRFLKYAGATAGVVGASALGTDYVLSPRPAPVNQSTVTLNPMRSTSNQNHPPVADFSYKPHCLDPTNQQTIQFTNLSSDLDDDPLTYGWLVDNQPVSIDKDYSTQLPVGQHEVGLEVSDPFAKSTAAQTVTVEPDQIYPTKPLHLRHKGFTYFTGPVPPAWPSLPRPTDEEMDEQLDTIREGLGCNAIIISGGEDYEDRLIVCGRMAIEKGFERIHIQPRYMDATSSETVEKIGRFATKVRSLREASESVVYCVGHEFSNETAILPGDTWIERFTYMAEKPDWPEKVEAVLPKMFRDIVAVCKQNYGYTISYAAIAVVEVDLVPWENSIFESVGVDAMIQEEYGWTEDWILSLLSGLKRYRKPVNCMEAGCPTFTGAGKIDGTAPTQFRDTLHYDEDEQANWINRECSALDRATIDGYFYTIYNDNWDMGYGVYNPQTRKRKKGFYTYKSYQRTS